MTEYRNRPTLDKLDPYYSRHISAMTTEDLFSKSDIAAELAVRDKRIADLEQQLSMRTKVWTAAVALREFWRGFRGDESDISLAVQSGTLIAQLCRAVEESAE